MFRENNPKCKNNNKWKHTDFLLIGFGDFRWIALANFLLSCWAVFGNTSVTGKSSKFVDNGLSAAAIKIINKYSNHNNK